MSTILDELLLFFIAASIYQILFVVLFRRRYSISFKKCIVKTALYYTIMLEIVIVITIFFNFMFRKTVLEGWFTTRDYFLMEYNVIIALSVCIIYQGIYYVINKRISDYNHDMKVIRDYNEK
jgi:hypothetical protein